MTPRARRAPQRHANGHLREPKIESACKFMNLARIHMNVCESM
jgi:hypothetical protein